MKEKKWSTGWEPIKQEDLEKSSANRISRTKILKRGICEVVKNVYPRRKLKKGRRFSCKRNEITANARRQKK